MAFTANDVKTLRERTGCGMMDCKKALTESNGDMDKAIEFLREKAIETFWLQAILNVAMEKMAWDSCISGRKNCVHSCRITKNTWNAPMAFIRELVICRGAV